MTAISAVPTVAAAAAISTAVLIDAGRPSAAPMPLPAASVSGGHSAAIGGRCTAGTCATGASGSRRGEAGRQRQQRQHGEAAGGARQRPPGGSAALLEPRPEGPSRPGEQHLHRSGRDLQARRDLHEREAVDVLEQERGALTRGQIADGRFEESRAARDCSKGSCGDGWPRARAPGSGRRADPRR